MARKDILLDDNYEPLIVDGDFFIGESDQQNIELIVLANKGDFRETPQLGFGIRNRIGEPFKNNQQLKNELNVALKMDGYSAKSVSIDDNGNLDIQLK